MSVSNGQKAEATVFNNAFVSKTVNSSMAGVLELANGGSGATVANVQQAINNDVAALASHLSDSVGAHDASAIANTPSGNLSATQVQAALNELQSDIDTRTTSAQAASVADAQIAAVRGVANGLASLNGSGLIPASELPSFVDDVLEFADLAGFPVSGETGKIYVAIDTGKTYRWTGTIYVEISSGAVGSVNGQTGIVVITKTDVGLGNVDNTSDATKNSASVVLTNKDIDGGTAANTRRITLPKDTKANLDALTRKEATIVYASDQDKVYADNGTTLVELASGSSQAVVAFRASSTAGTTLTGGGGFVDIPFATESFDTVSAYASPTFTAPDPGYYSADFNLYSNAVTMTGVQGIAGRFVVTGKSSGNYDGFVEFGNAASKQFNVKGGMIFDMNAGDTIKIQAASDVTVNLNTTSNRNFFQVSRINGT